MSKEKKFPVKAFIIVAVIVVVAWLLGQWIVPALMKAVLL